MLFVQAPCFLHRDPIQVHLVEHDVQGFYSSLQVRGVCFLEVKPFLFEVSPCFMGLFNSLFGEVHIGPPGKTILLIPYAFAVANQDYFLHTFDSVYKLMIIPNSLLWLLLIEYSANLHNFLLISAMNAEIIPTRFLPWA